MPKAKRYTSEQIGNAQKILRSLSNKNVGKSRAEVAGILAGEIRQAVERGYSLKEIRAVLAQVGVSIPLTRLQTVLDGENEKDGELSCNGHEQDTGASGESPPAMQHTEEPQGIPSKGD